MGRATRKTTNEHNYEMKHRKIAEIHGIEVSELWYELNPGKGNK